MENWPVQYLAKIDREIGVIITEFGISAKEFSWPVKQMKIHSIFLKIQVFGSRFKKWAIGGLICYAKQ